MWGMSALWLKHLTLNLLGQTQGNWLWGHEIGAGLKDDTSRLGTVQSPVISKYSASIQRRNGNWSICHLIYLTGLFSLQSLQKDSAELFCFCQFKTFWDRLLSSSRCHGLLSLSDIYHLMDRLPGSLITQHNAWFSLWVLNSPPLLPAVRHDLDFTKGYGEYGSHCNRLYSHCLLLSGPACWMFVSSNTLMIATFSDLVASWADRLDEVCIYIIQSVSKNPFLR